MLWTRQRFAAAVAIAMLLCVPAAPAAPAAEKLLLSEKHYWRKHYTFIPPKVSVQAAKAKGLPTDAASRAKYLARFYFTGIQTPPPPADWVKLDFDDSAWRIARGRQFHVGDRRVLAGTPIDGTDVYLRGTDSFVEEVGLICHRATFKVNDPAKVKALALSLTYRGGFVAYLNGTEVARAHLPAGKIDPDSAADDYPLEAHFERDSIGKPKRRYLSTFNRQWKPARDSDQWALRERSFGPKPIKLAASPGAEVDRVPQVPDVELVGYLADVALPVLHDQRGRPALDDLLLELRHHPHVHRRTDALDRGGRLDADDLPQVHGIVDALGQALGAPGRQGGFPRPAGRKGNSVGSLKPQSRNVSLSLSHVSTGPDIPQRPPRRNRRGVPRVPRVPRIPRGARVPRNAFRGL